MANENALAHEQTGGARVCAWACGTKHAQFDLGAIKTFRNL